MNAIAGNLDGRTLSEAAGCDNWRKTLACFCLERASLEGQRLGLVKYTGNKWEICSDRNPYTGRKMDSLQSLVTLQICWKDFGEAIVSNKLVSEISDRVKRWKGNSRSVEEDCRRSLEIAHHKGKHLPARFLFGFWQSMFYGWLTDKRLCNGKPTPIRSCVLCCGQEALDDFYHYAHCDVVWSAFTRLGLSRPGHRMQRNIRYLLLLDGDFNVELRLAFLHSVMISVHKLRSPFVSVCPSLREKYIRDNFKDQICSDSRLKKAFKELWNFDVFAL